MDKKEAKGKALRLLEIGTHRVNSVTRNTQCCFQRSEAQIDRRGTFPIALVNIFNFLLIRQMVMSYMQHSWMSTPPLSRTNTYRAYGIFSGILP